MQNCGIHMSVVAHELRIIAHPNTHSPHDPTLAYAKKQVSRAKMVESVSIVFLIAVVAVGNHPP
jgi:hypothetical protein